LVAVRALQELGPGQVFAYAAYQIGKRLGLVERAVSKGMRSAAQSPGILALNLLNLPEVNTLHDCLGPSGMRALFAEADEICSGKVRLFGGAPVPLQFNLPVEKLPWMKYEGTAWLDKSGDIKVTWEPARFGWAVVLARAYHISGNKQYVEAFWHWTEAFFAANPPGFGPQWASAQEAALRLMCLVFAWQVFGAAPESTPERAASLAGWIAVHAARIPPTLSYARAQNNNHLLSEAAGLYTAALALPEHPQASRWRALGWRWLNQGLLKQIDPDGSYCQHSSNYHRLMLQLALWIHALATCQDQIYPRHVFNRLNAATRWLSGLLNPTSGQTPNLGPNDGAYIFPFSSCAYSDYRPILQAAGIAFNASRVSAAGAWDEMALWYGLRLTSESSASLSAAATPAVLRSAGGRTWAYLRAARFSGRPGHADQLHLDLWLRGLNLALDAGTYLYNSPPPWDNRLAEAFVHNTITLEGQDQMRRAGRFLYLQPAQAEITEQTSQPERDWERLVARHNGYRRLGCLHVRQVEHLGLHWLVRDQIVASRGQVRQPITARLHWLLPDLPWEIVDQESGVEIKLATKHGPVSLQLSTSLRTALFLLTRAGERLAGSGEVQPVWGWYSPTYGVKLPALSLSLTASGTLPIQFTSAWDLGDD
jgi:hypothetical protein